MDFESMMAALDEVEEILALRLHRRIMNRIHEGGSIWYDKCRLEAYARIAKIASDLRLAQRGGRM